MIKTLFSDIFRHFQTRVGGAIVCLLEGTLAWAIDFGDKFVV